MREPTGREPRSSAPAPSADVVPRRRVHELLDGATSRVAVVRAPAGYGKTSQVAAWAAADGRPVAWADLEPIDDDPSVLLALLLDVLRHVTDLERTRPTNVRVTPGQAATLAGPALGRLLARCTSPFILVLDDVHVVTSRDAADLLDAIVRHVPAGSTLVLVGRSEPAVPLGRQRAHAGVVDVTTDDLALDLEDAHRLLATLGVDADAASAERLVAQTEGWPVGLRLAALSVRESDDDADDRTCTAHDLALAAYLREEWLRGLDPDDVDFLLAVSGLDWLSGPLCDAVLDRAESGERLRRLHARRGIVMPLDRRGDAYRMHRLLRDVLDAEHERSDRRRRCLVDLRASEWFERTGDIDRAVHHALRADDLALAERLVDTHAASYQVNGRPATVARWLRAFPRAYTLASAPLCLASAINTLVVGDAAAATTWLHFGTQALTGPPSAATDDTTELKIAAYRALISTDELDRALADAARAYRRLPPGLWHALACLAHGALSFAIGEDDLAGAVLAEGAVESRLVGAPTLEALCQANLAIALGDADDWARATTTARAAREVVRTNHLEEMPTMAVVVAVSALVEAMAGDPELASVEIASARCLLATIDTVAAWGNVQARLALARASLLLGDRVAARTFADEAEVLLRGQQEATRSHAQLDDLVEQLRTARAVAQFGPSALTTAELRVLHHLPTNLTLGEIATRLFVSRNTAKSHAAAVYRKLGATSRSEAVRLAREAGLLPAGDSLPISA